MPSVSETTTIPAPIDVVWPLLSDPARVAACIPGATLSADQSDGLWRGAIRVKFGPTVAAFRGEATLAYDHTAHTCTIEGRGIDQRGASRALANGLVKARGAGAATELDVAGEFTVTGPLETFANAGGVHVARALLAEFSANMARMIAEEGRAAPASQPASITDIASPAPSPAAAPASSPAPVPTPATIGAGRILWLAFKSWLSSLFRKGS